MRIPGLAGLLVGLALVASACAAAPGGQEELGDATSPQTGTTVAVVEPVNTSPAPDPKTLLSSADEAREYLAALTGVGLERVELSVQEEVIWPNGAVGCPEAGMSYTQALVSGSRLVFQIDGQAYAFHAGVDGVYSYCETPTEPVGKSPDA